MRNVEEVCSEGSTKHKVYLAVDLNLPSLYIMRKDYDNSGLNFYHYNYAQIEPNLGHADKMTYPMLNEALKLSRTNAKNSIMTILFNAPLESWKNPPNNGDSNNGEVRVRVECPDLLKRLYSVCGYQLVIGLQGSLSRKTFQNGKIIPLERENKSIVMRVNEDGSTTEESTKMARGLMGLYSLKGIFTLSLEFIGPGPVLCGGILASKKLLGRTYDFKLFSSDQRCYNIHSQMMIALSPVFEAMMNSGLSESTNRAIRFKDVDGVTLEAFWKYAYHGSFQDAYTDSELCYKLFYFGHTYQITELETAARELFQGKASNWISTRTALMLYCFASGLNDGERLVDKTLTIIQSRRQEVYKLEEFSKLSVMYSNLEAVIGTNEK